MSAQRIERTYDMQFGEYIALDSFNPVTLPEVVERADLAHRVDRKYLVDLDTVRQLCEGLTDTHQVLQIDDRRTTTYRTTYFDTPDLMSCRAHIQGRRRRWKVRSRLYVEDRLCRVEVKTKNGRGMTFKSASPSHVDRYGTLIDDDRSFVTDALASTHPEVDIASLISTAEITYTRACLVDLNAGTRMTIDGRLQSILSGGCAWVDDAYAIVETKGGNIPSGPDRLLVHLGAKPRPFSKYVATTSLVHPDIADNDIRDLHGSRLHCRLSSS